MINYNPDIKKKINNSKILIIDNFLEKKLYQNIAAEINKLKKNRKCEKVFIYKKKIIKEEFNNYNYFYKNQKKLIKLISSKRFEIFLKNNFNIKHSLFPEKSNMFSGFNFARRGSYLRPHADFNFNSKMKKFRTINLLLYLTQ